jgi:hypothetical protein
MNKNLTVNLKSLMNTFLLNEHYESNVAANKLKYCSKLKVIERKRRIRSAEGGSRSSEFSAYH